MIDFITENFLIFIFAGVALILVAIGYIVDKFVINKNKTKNTVEEKKETIEETVEPVNEVVETADNSLPSETLAPELLVEETKTEDFENVEVDNVSEQLMPVENNDYQTIVNEPLPEQVNSIVEEEPISEETIDEIQESDNHLEKESESTVLLQENSTPIIDSQDEEDVVVTQPLFESENQDESIDNNSESVWKV